MTKFILLSIVYPMALLCLPLVAILLWIRVRKSRMERKAIKKSINEGTWLEGYNYKMTAKAQKKLDKWVTKQEKKKYKRGK